MLLAAPILLALGCGPAGDRAPLAGWNLVVVNVDTLRADHLGFHGYPRATSPTLDALAGQAVVFENAMASSSYTRESVASLLTGRLPSRGAGAGWHATPPDASAPLGVRLRAAGYRTGFFSNTLMLRHPGFTNGFDEAEHLPAHWDLSGEGLRLSRRALRFARESGDRRFAMYLHYLDPHAPYEPAPELLAELAPPGVPEAPDLYREIWPRLAELKADGFGPGDPRFESLLLRYDAEILGTDEAIGALVRGLEALGVSDRTLLVVTADHGEEFLEHGGVEHGWTLHQESIHVPLLFFAPGALRAARVRERVSQVDVLPTLVALLGLPEEGRPLDGRSLFLLDARSAQPLRDERAIVAELLIPFRNVVRTALRGDWKLVSATRWLPPEQRFGAREVPGAATPLDLGLPPVHELLFDLRTDPSERSDRSAEFPAIAGSLRERLAVLPSSVPVAQPPAVPLATDERERLRALGYESD